MKISTTSRRHFLKSALFGGVAALSGPGLNSAVFPDPARQPGAKLTRVGLISGEDHVDNIFQALDIFRNEIRERIGGRRVVIKPNNVAIDSPLSATPAEAVEAILEFLKSIGKLDGAVIGESAANGPTLDGFDNYGYLALADRYGVKALDLDQEPVDQVHVFDEGDFRPHAVRMSNLLLDPDRFIISAAKMKTHDRVVATLSLKNIVFGAPIKDLGFRWGRGGKPGAKTDKPIAHGSGIRGINFNLFALAQRLHPDLAVIDGFQGMEGNGPVGGTPVEHRVAVVSPDWLAADRLAVELMGIDFAKVGYLNYCAQAGMGEADLSRIEVVGARVQDHIKPYKLHSNIDRQLIWMQPPEKA